MADLMNKKKKELVEIILRKDALEKDLRGDVKRLEDAYVVLKTKMEADYKCASIIIDKREKRITSLKQRCWLWFSCFIAALGVLLAVVL